MPSAPRAPGSPPPAAAEKEASAVPASAESRTGGSSASRPRLASLQVGRGVAALLVLLYHAHGHLELNGVHPPLGSWLRFGHVGVDYFFVLSGFVMLHAHRTDLGRPGATRGYAVKRAVRLLPMYWLALGVCLALRAVSSGTPFPTIREIALDLVLIPNGAETPIVGVAWSLHLEVFFYALFGLVLWRPSLGRLLMAAWFGVSLLRGLGLVDLEAGPAVHRWLSGYPLQFGMGLLVAWLAPVGGAARGPLALGTLALVGGIVAELTGNLDSIGFPAQLLYGGGSALLLLGLLRREAAAPIHASGPLRLLGDASYSIYLFHLAGIGIADKLLQVIGIDDDLHPDGRFAFVVAGGLALGTALGTWIEPRLTRAVRARLR